MADYFVAMIPGRQLVTTFQQIETTRVVCTIPLVANDQIQQFGLSLLKPLPATPDNTELGVSVHLCVQHISSEQLAWQYLGPLSNARPTDIFRISQSLEDLDPTKLNEYQLHIGLNMEPMEELSKQVPVAAFDNNKILHSARGIAEDLHRYIASFDTIPANVIDKWYTRFQERHKREPYFWLQEKV